MAAKVKNRNIYRGSSKVWDTSDKRRSSAIEMLNVDDIDGDLDSALRAAWAEVAPHTRVGNQIIPLQSITANWVGNTNALCVAKFGFKGGTKSGGFKTGISLKTGHGSARWIQRSHSSTGGPMFRGAGDKKDKGGIGSPNGVIQLDNNEHPKQYTWKMPIWIITVAVITRQNPASTIGHYIAHINSNLLNWDGFKIPIHTLRFDGANIDYLRNNYGVTYQFSHRRDGWFEQWSKLNATNQPKIGKKGQPIKGDSPENIVKARMLPEMNFANPNFPEE